jgi:hypothetical protein
MGRKNTTASGRATRATAGTDAIEVKVTVVDRHENMALRKLGLDRKDGEQRRIFFYDTPTLDLYKSGIVLRARETGDACDSTVKIRPVDPKHIAAKWRERSGFKVEADAVGSQVMCSASFTTAQKRREIDEVASGDRAIEKLFSGEQEEFLHDMAPARLDFASLVPLGPVEVVRWKFRNEGIPYELCAEEWLLPDRRDVIEISLKARQPEAAAAQAALDAFLTDLGITGETRQNTKTRMALEYFAGRR